MVGLNCCHLPALLGALVMLVGAQAAPASASEAGAGFSILEQAPQTLPARLEKARQLSLHRLQGHLDNVPLRLEMQPNGSFAFLRTTEPTLPLWKGFAERLPPEEAARGFLERYAGLFGLEEADLDTLQVDRNEVIGQTRGARGVHYVSFVQRQDGVRVHKARVTFAIHVDTGDLYSITSNVFGAPAPNSSRDFRLEPEEAVTKMMESAGVSGSIAGTRSKNTRLEVLVEGPALEGPVVVERAYLTARPGTLVPGYVGYLWTRDHGLLEIGVDARNGRHLQTSPLTASLAMEFGGWPDYPMDEAGVLRAPELIEANSDALASPRGWLAEPGEDELYRTIGPNVVSFYDWEDIFTGYEFEEAMRPYTASATDVRGLGESRVVSFDYLDQWGWGYPEDQVDLSLSQNFWYLNMLHDHYYALGFTETEGNFQGDDPVLANVQNAYDLGSRNNANFSTPPDGISGRMNMYVFVDEAGELRDGAIDPHVVSHELGHGLSHRLVNFGDNYLWGAQSAAFGEGMSDVFAFMRSRTLESHPDAWALSPFVGWQYFTYVLRGEYSYLVTGNFANDMLAPMGRFTAYSYEVGDIYKIQDPRAQRTFGLYGSLPVAAIGNGAYGNRYTGFYGDWTYYLAPETHSDGEIWAAALWRVRRRLETHDWATFETADRLTAFEQTALMGMQLMPANPSFIQARDALMIYEEMTQAESAVCMMKYEFARSGMGRSAFGGSSGSYGGDTHWDSEAQSFPEMISDYEEWGCEPGSYEQDSGEVLMIYTSPTREVEIGKETSLDLLAMTPGYQTQVVLTGPFIGTIRETSESDTISKSWYFTPTRETDGDYACTVSSEQGQSETETLEIKSVVATELSPMLDAVESYVALDENHHYKFFVESAAYATGDKVVVTLDTLDDVDIDLYYNVDTLALPTATMGYDADEDGHEVLNLERGETGWTVVAGSGDVFGVYADGENFYFYVDVAGYTASNYRLEVARENADGG